MQNDSGYYDKSILRDAAKHYNIPYNTLRMDLKKFQSFGWLDLHGSKIRLKTMTPGIYACHKTLKKYQDKVFEAKSPATMFADILKAVFFKRFLITQGIKEAQKIKDKSVKAKFLRRVKRKATTLGAQQGIHAGIRTIASLYNKSSWTGMSYLRRMESTGILKAIKHNVKVDNTWRNPEIYGRTFLKDGQLFMRTVSSYAW